MSGVSAAVQVPLLDLRIQYRALKQDIDAAIARVVDSQYFILGPEVTALEAEVAAYSGAGHAVGMSSGTDALLAALMAIDVRPGQEVVTTPYTFFATAGTIARLGARPVFVDIDPLTFNINAAAVVSALTDHTAAIMPVHLYGRVVDMDPILHAARHRGVPVIEDAAQAIGARDRVGRSAGTIGEMGCFSFFPSKNLGGFGDGGMTITSDAGLARRLTMLRTHGMEPKYYHPLVGGNFRLDALQAAVLRVKLRHLDSWSAGRRRNAALYRQRFADGGRAAVAGPGVRVSEELPIVLPQDEPGHSYNQFVIRAHDRDALQTHLRAQGVGTEIYYPLPLHLQECFADLGYAPGSLPHAEAAARETLALPIYPELTQPQIEHVVNAATGFYAR